MDSQFSKALTAGVESDIYVVRNGLLYFNMPDRQCLCILDIRIDGKDDGGGKNLQEMLIERNIGIIFAF